MQTPAKPWGENKAHLQKYIGLPKQGRMCCTEVDLVAAFNGRIVFAWGIAEAAGVFMEMDRK